MGNKVWILLGAFLFLLAGCGSPKGTQADRTGFSDEEEKLKVVTTIFPPYDFVRQVAGDRAEVIMLLKPGMESHSYEPSPRDILAIMDSDFFFYAGGESDVWVEEILSANDGDTKAFALLDWVDPLAEETSEGMQVKGHDHAHEEEEEGHAVHLEEAEYDEHVWTSPRNAMAIVEKICALLSDNDPENAEYYEENAQNYLKRLQELDDAFTSVVEKAKRRTMVFGDRFPLLYFVRTYGLEFYAAFPGCSSETEPSASTIAFLTDEVRREGIPLVFYLEMSNGKIAEAIAEASGAQTAVFYSVHGITAEDMEAGEDYLSLMYKNVETLKKALW